jgi:hypothetical protein
MGLFVVLERDAMNQLSPSCPNTGIPPSTSFSVGFREGVRLVLAALRCCMLCDSKEMDLGEYQRIFFYVFVPILQI